MSERWGYEIDDACLECSEPCDPDRDEVVVGPDKQPIGYVHDECVDVEVLW